MAEPDPVAGHKKTAVLVVHGIGSQRALETVRGVMRGVWLDKDNPADQGKRVWSHPERGGEDIDLTVLTTNEVPGSTDGRLVDFHELYWAHLMSETKAVAVLLWLYELVRKGPFMKRGMNALWWGSAVFLCLMNLAIASVVLLGIWRFSQNSAQNILVAPFLVLVGCLGLGLLVAWKWHASRLRNWILAFGVAGVALLGIYALVEWLVPPQGRMPDGVELFALVALPTLVALIATLLVMGRQGLRAFWRAIGISAFVSVCFVVADRFWNPELSFAESAARGWLWGVNSPWSVAAAAAVIGLYLILNAVFLQSYLGDAARYFRGSPGNVAVRRAIRKEAVDTLERLHTGGQYDRIVVVAHSLGTVVAYDMLRAYYSRVCDELPPIEQLGTDFDRIDKNEKWKPEDKAASIEDRKALRTMARAAIASIATIAAAAKQPNQPPPYKNWLVTDFVTLGSALTHAYFLMCIGPAEKDLESEDELKQDFARRVEEREFPTCPPKRLDQDGLLTFLNPKTLKRQAHNGGLFGLTRWSNIYFPRLQLFWGDAIGGALSPIFGYHILDLEVSTDKAGGADFFTHTAYWDVHRKPDRCDAPHILALRKAVDLVDKYSAIALVDEAADPDKHAAE